MYDCSFFSVYTAPSLSFACHVAVLQKSAVILYTLIPPNPFLSLNLRVG